MTLKGIKKICGTCLVLQIPDGFLAEYYLKLDFPTTNNEAEYEALITGIGLAKVLRVKNIKILGDSRLMVSQVNDDYEARKIFVKTLTYILIDGVLCKKSFLIPYLKCLRPTEVETTLREVHGGICGQHQGAEH